MSARSGFTARPPLVLLLLALLLGGIGAALLLLGLLALLLRAGGRRRRACLTERLNGCHRVVSQRIADGGPEIGGAVVGVVRRIERCGAVGRNAPDADHRVAQ